jgi:hypothetical protein
VKSAQVPEIKYTHGVLEDPDQRGKELRRRRARLRNTFKLNRSFYFPDVSHGVGPEPVLGKTIILSMCFAKDKGKEERGCLFVFVTAMKVNTCINVYHALMYTMFMYIIECLFLLPP